MNLYTTWHTETLIHYGNKYPYHSSTQLKLITKYKLFFSWLNLVSNGGGGKYLNRSIVKATIKNIFSTKIKKLASVLCFPKSVWILHRHFWTSPILYLHSPCQLRRSRRAILLKILWYLFRLNNLSNELNFKSFISHLNRYSNGEKTLNVKLHSNYF